MCAVLASKILFSIISQKLSGVPKRSKHAFFGEHAGGALFGFAFNGAAEDASAHLLTVASVLKEVAAASPSIDGIKKKVWFGLTLIL